MQCMTVNVTQKIDVAKIQLSMLPPGCWLQHYAHTNPSVMQATVGNHKELNLDRFFAYWERYCLMEHKTKLKCMIVTDKTDFKCFESKIKKHSSLCWKLEYKQSLIPNYLKWIQVYSWHSFLCLTSYFAEGQKQLLLWLHTHKYSFVFNVIIWTQSTPVHWPSQALQYSVQGCRYAFPTRAHNIEGRHAANGLAVASNVDCYPLEHGMMNWLNFKKIIRNHNVFHDIFHYFLQIWIIWFNKWNLL